MARTQVKIRADWETDAKPLGEVEFDKIDDVIRKVLSWGIADYEALGEDDLFGQFVVNDREAYFEIVIATEDN